jgi:hypothetical protein
MMRQAEDIYRNLSLRDKYDFFHALSNARITAEITIA